MKSSWSMAMVVSLTTRLSVMQIALASMDQIVSPIHTAHPLSRGSVPKWVMRSGKVGMGR